MDMAIDNFNSLRNGDHYHAGENIGTGIVMLGMMLFPEGEAGTTKTETKTGTNLKTLSRAEKSSIFGGNIPLTAQELRSIKTYEELIIEHREKMTEYIKGPWKYDNQGLLKNAPSDAIRTKIIEARVKHLEHEINTFQKSIDKIKNKQE